jgi:hypothetical protein
MKIVFTRTGGVGGFRLSAQVDTVAKRVAYGASRSVKQLDDQQVKQLEDLVNRADFFNNSSSMPRGRQVYDAFEYSIEVESERKRHQVRWVGEDAPEKLRPLVEMLERLAKGTGAK